MSIPSPTNCWTHTEANLATALANCANFWALTGTSDANSAAPFIFGESLDMPLDGNTYSQEELETLYRHFGQVMSNPNQPYGKRLVDTRAHEAFGTAVIYLERLVPSDELANGDVPQSLHRKFKNLAGSIIDDLIVYMRTAGGPIMAELTVGQYGTNEREEWPDEGVRQGVDIIIDWGLGLGG